DLMRSSAQLARSYGVRLHTHVAETLDEEEFCLERYGCRPVQYAADLGWVGEDVSYAHGIYLNDEEIGLLAETGTGVAHCPTSNMLLGSGIAPVRKMLREGVKVGLAVDGSASNDSSHMLAEARMAMLLQRVKEGPQALGAREVLEMATLGGAQLLGREDIGSLEVGKAADLMAIDVNRLEYAGAGDLVAAAVFCAPAKVDFSMVDGRLVVKKGRLTTMDMEPIIARHNEIAREMLT
ncbi:MAG TPA: 8-oxoguanine deaminase, partial [Chloroflexi bacterium]|nr:8-oxoguanine deaminase [Chloroflexota bacterium]